MNRTLHAKLLRSVLFLALAVPVRAAIAEVANDSKVVEGMASIDVKFAGSRSYNEHTLQAIDAAVKQIVAAAFERARAQPRGTRARRGAPAAARDAERGPTARF